MLELITVLFVWSEMETVCVLEKKLEEEMRRWMDIDWVGQRDSRPRRMWILEWRLQKEVAWKSAKEDSTKKEGREWEE